MLITYYGLFKKLVLVNDCHFQQNFHIQLRDKTHSDMLLKTHKHLKIPRGIQEMFKLKYCKPQNSNPKGYRMTTNTTIKHR